MKCGTRARMLYPALGHGNSERNETKKHMQITSRLEKTYAMKRGRNEVVQEGLL